MRTKAWPSLQHGIGMIEVMLIIAVFSSLLLAGFLQWRVRSAEEATRQEQTQLAQAETALISYATVNYRLPCPAAVPGGLEDCTTPAQKGWFPAQTLIVSGIDPGVSVKQLRYIVQRGGSDFDLASVASDAWRPVEYSGNSLAMRDTSYSSAPIRTLSDFCARLAQGRSQTYNAGYASVASSPGRLVAFALAHPGLEDKDGDGNLFDGVNALNSTPAFEPADRGSLLSSYDDVVSERSFSSLATAFNCDTLNNSIDSVALAHDLVTVVRGMRDENIDSANTAVAWAAVSAVLAGVAIVQTGVGIASNAGNAGVDAAICAATLGFAVNACAAIGVHAGAAAIGGGVIGLNAVSIGGSIAAIVMAEKAKTKAMASGSDASTISTLTSAVACLPPGDTTTASLTAQSTAAIDSFNAQITQATNTRTIAQIDLAAARIELAQAQVARQNAINQLVAAARNNTAPATSTIDGDINMVVSLGDNLLPLQTDYAYAQATVDAAQTKTINATANLAKYQNMLDNRAAFTISTQTAVDAASVTLANLRSSGASQADIDAAAKTYNLLFADLLILKNQGPPTGSTPTLADLRDGAQVELTDATAALSVAQASLTIADNNRTTSANNYTSAYDNLLLKSAGNYTIFYPPLSSPSFVVSCTTGVAGGPLACGTTTVSTYGDVRAKLIALVGFGGDNGRSAPAADSVFSKPEKIQRKITALESEITAYSNMITDLQTRRDELAAETATALTPLPTCTTTTRNNSPFSPSFAQQIIEVVDRKGGSR